MNIITFEEIDGQTTLTMQGGPVNATAEERAAFDEMAPMVKQGFGGTFDQLAEHLESQQ